MAESTQEAFDTYFALVLTEKTWIVIKSIKLDRNIKRLRKLLKVIKCTGNLKTMQKHTG